ncbi:hypothetical protein HHK36_033423 [Tetracentron sinense]|uniref:Protein FAR1-RELATED SEQUENCE n=1 Tax=Tetracentron sinense TaxID=13715 RepID=A0A835CZJ0_TETSI|nr:hypothetical protein HHK36_033423 [Tetracentron sinense]
MENEVIEYDIVLGDDAAHTEDPVDDDEMVESSGGGEFYVPEGDTNLEPYVGREFESEEAAKAFYNSYARRVGFSTRINWSRRSSRDGRIVHRIFVCAKEGFRVEKRSRGSVVEGDEDQCMSNIFWVDPKARMNYTYFGDTVTFDSTYRSNRYRLPFAPFIGVNHHGQPLLFGCAVLLNESEASLIWLFNTWLRAMLGHPPVSITTDYDRMIRSAIKQVLPETRHRFCKWHIFKEGQEKLSHVFLEHPSFEAEFHRCVNLTESIEEFEWVPVYLRDTFFAEMSITQRSDSRTHILMVEDDGAITTYRVAKFGEDHKAYFVRLNVLEMSASCSCQMFQFSGLLCRHVLTVFRVTNVLTLPSHCVLKRWTRNAKSSVILEEHEGVNTIDIYNVAMGAIQQAAKIVSLAKKNGGRMTLVNGSGEEGSGTDGSGYHQCGFGVNLCLWSVLFYLQF